MSGQPKASFWVAVWLVILALAGFAAWKAGMLDQFGARPGAAGPWPGMGTRAPGGRRRTSLRTRA
ncbi:MAG: hypothetical protein EBX35_05925 [Planctomycetia bacterium]|nr:hypothetical protein [Planctomycetia bacterium]